MYYLQSRYYDPELGRFLNADAFASTGQGLLGNNMFTCCLNNPINYIDSTGCFPWAVVLVIGICVAVGIIYGATTNRNIAEEMREQGDAPYNPTPPPVTPPQQSTSSPLPPYQNDSISPTNKNITPNNTQPITTPSESNTSIANKPLTPKDRINNILIGAAVGLMVGGAIVLTGGAVACVCGYAAVVVPVVGMSGSQIVAWGILSYNVFPIFAAPLLGMETEALEYPS